MTDSYVPTPRPGGPFGPGSQPYPYGPQPRDTSGLATAAIGVAAALTAVQVLSAITSFGVEDAIRSARPGEVALTAYDAVTLLLLPALAAAYVVTCRWLSRARANAVLLSGPDGHERSAVWVWLGWWVPVVLLWFPYQVVRDLQRTSSFGTSVLPHRLALWWTCWLLTGVGYRVTAAVSSDIDSVSLLPACEIASAVVMVVGLWQWTRIVRGIQLAQRLRLDGVR